MSNFLLWQSGKSYFCVLNELWPELSSWSILKSLLRYYAVMPVLEQRRMASTARSSSACTAAAEHGASDRVREFLNRRQRQLREVCWRSRDRAQFL